ncbi:MAG TPA: nucleoside phosphorylase [Azospirillum sp.]|nr:nucleoside phosphorylase [Azospirillum sp.]
MTRLGVLTGVTAEARVLGVLSGAPPLVACSGADAERARALAAGLVARGATALVSVGLAGGLAEGWERGTLLLATEVELPDGSVRTVDRAWREDVLTRAHAAGVHLAGGRLASARRVMATPADKRALAEHSGAVAVDMESHAVALAAQTAGLPFLVLRAVADPWNAAIPPPALAGLGPDGTVRALAVAACLAREPWHLPDLLRLARDSRAGLTSLRAALARLGTLNPP